METMPNRRLPDSAHTMRDWRIHELTRDFEIEDVWALPTPGGRNDFHLLVERFASGDPAQESNSKVAGALWAIRWKLGEVFGWDGDDSGLGERVPTVKDRLPDDLRATPGPDFGRLPFEPLYLTEDEWAAEIANKTVHGVMHVGWVPDGGDRYHGQMTVLVKPNGLFGRVYMTAIKPFRHLIVYPAMMRRIESEWTSGLRGR